MITIEQHLCNVMWRFVKAHTEEIKESYDSLGFKSKTDMLNAIKVDWQTAYWALTELLVWGMKKNHTEKFFASEREYYSVYKIGSRFLKKPWFNDGIVEVKQVVKTITVMDWEDMA